MADARQMAIDELDVAVRELYDLCKHAQVVLARCMGAIEADNKPAINPDGELQRLSGRIDRACVRVGCYRTILEALRE